MRDTPRGEMRHVLVASLFNVVAFNMFSAFAQLSGATSRVIIIAYSMPIWATLLGRFVLGERMNAIRWIAFMLCVAGLSILVWPQFADGFPPTVFYALGCAIGWALATVYIKWAKVTVEPLVNAAWQLLFGVLLIGIGMLVFDGEGNHLGTVRIPELSANFNWGGDDLRDVFVTASTSLYRYRVKVPGPRPF